MERAQPARRVLQSGIDNSLSTYIPPEKDRNQSRTGALSALKASFGLKDANSPTRSQLTPTSQQRTPTSNSSPSKQLSSGQHHHRAHSFGTPRQASVEVSTDNFEHGKLYEAYNELHALAQAFQKPFDAPAILVVGHQTDGKSGELYDVCLWYVRETEC